MTADHQKDAIGAWWSAFQAKKDDIDALFSQKAQWDLPEWMQMTLQAIDPHLMWEFGPAVDKEGHRLVITPESRRHLRPLVAEILRQAPELENWEFYGYRLPENYEQALRTVEGRSGGDISNTYFRATIDDFNKIDLVFCAPNYMADDEQALSDVFVATETLLGEEVLDKWIGAVDVATLDDEGIAESHHIRALQPRIDGLLAEIRDTLPDVPCRQYPEDQEWTLYKMEPREADEYPEQTDMFVGKSMIPAMWQNAHSAQSFDSVRFSKCGEVFCYIKMDGSEGLDEEKFADKGEIEDTVDEALREAEVGCFVGGGTGLRYSYIDLALEDVDRGCGIVQQVLRDGNISKRSWILFFDDDLQAQWIGIWDDSPAPPMPDVE